MLDAIGTNERPPAAGWLLPSVRETAEPMPIPKRKTKPTNRQWKTRMEKALEQANLYAQLMQAASAYITINKPKCRHAADVAELLRPLVATKPHEELWVILLDPRNHVIRLHLCTIGLADRSQAHAREIFREAIIHNACKIVLAHNHPSGDPMPSPQDIECTRGLTSAGRLIGIEVTDHIVVGHRTPERERDYVSLRELNLMDGGAA